MIDMIERVATAILREQQSNRSQFPSNLDLARASIEAMREPTAAMLQAFDEAMDVWLREKREDADVWRAMVDAALAHTSQHEGG